MKTFPELETPEGIQVHLDHPTLRVDLKLVQQLVDHILERHQVRGASIQVILTTAEKVQDLNMKWLGHIYPTDVLSFPLGEGGQLEGEVYVSLDFAQAHCREYNASFINETCRYVTHGILHLLGYTDSSGADRALMRQQEDACLKGSGIPAHA